MGAAFDLYRIVAPGRVGAKPPALPLTRAAGLEANGSIAPDGNWIAFLSTEDGQYQIWIARKDGTAARPIAAAAPESEPVWSPDAQQIAFAAGGRLVVVPSAGGPARTLEGPPGLRTPSFSRDGATILAANASGLWRLPLASGSATAIPTGLGSGPGAERPIEDYNGQSLFFWSKGRIYRYLLGSRRALALEAARPDAWTVRPQGVYFFPPDRPVLERIDFARQATVEMFDLPADWIAPAGSAGRILDVSPDESWFLLCRPAAAAPAGAMP